MVLCNYSNSSSVNKLAKILHSDTLLVLLLLLFSGNPVIMNQRFIDVALIIFAVYLAFLMPGRHIRIFSPKFYVVGGLFGFIIILQSILFSFYPAITIAGFFTRLFIGYGVFRLVKNFPFVYVRAMFYLATLSMIFYIPREISIISGFDLMEKIGFLEKLFSMRVDGFSYKLLLHTYPKPLIYQHRNAGMFWEPGAFSGHLIMAIVFLGMAKNKMSRRSYRIYLFVITVTLFTTLSTTGFLVLPLALMTHYEWRPVSIRKGIGSLLVVFIILPITIVVINFSFKELKFMEGKIIRHLQKVEKREEGWYKTRFGSLVFDWEYIKRRPVIGWGLHSKTRYSMDPWVEGSEGMGNGFSDFMAKFGVSGMLVFLISLYKGMINYTKGEKFKSFLVLLIVLFVLQGEPFMGFPFFLGLMFLDMPGFSPSNSRKSQYPKTSRITATSHASEAF